MPLALNTLETEFTFAEGIPREAHKQKNKHEARQDNIDGLRHGNRRGTAPHIQTATSGVHGPKSERQPEEPMVAVEDETGD